MTTAATPLCACDTPTLARDELAGIITCFTCGSSPREDLGGSDDLERVRYRAELNRLRQSVEVTPAQRRDALKAERVAAAKELKARGLSNGQIAYKLNLSTVTVRTYLNPAYAESAKASRERSRKKNAEKVAETRRRYREKNAERERQRKREWAARNRLKQQAYMREWRAKNPEYRERESERSRRRRAAA